MTSPPGQSSPEQVLPGPVPESVHGYYSETGVWQYQTVRWEGSVSELAPAAVAETGYKRQVSYEGDDQGYRHQRIIDHRMGKGIGTDKFPATVLKLVHQLPHFLLRLFIQSECDLRNLGDLLHQQIILRLVSNDFPGGFLYLVQPGVYFTANLVRIQMKHLLNRFQSLIAKCFGKVLTDSAGCSGTFYKFKYITGRESLQPQMV